MTTIYSSCFVIIIIIQFIYTITNTLIFDTLMCKVTYMRIVVCILVLTLFYSLLIKHVKLRPSLAIIMRQITNCSCSFKFKCSCASFFALLNTVVLLVSCLNLQPRITCVNFVVSDFNSYSVLT